MTMVGPELTTAAAVADADEARRNDDNAKVRMMNLQMTESGEQIICRIPLDSLYVVGV